LIEKARLVGPDARRWLLVGGAVGFVVGTVFGCALASGDRHRLATTSSATAAPAAMAEAAAPAPTSSSVVESATSSAQSAEPASPWTYKESKDPMRDKVTKTTCTTSLNTAKLPSPYSDVTARLCLRRSPKFGTDAFVHLDGDGQILCTSYQGCRVHVRYGDRPVVTFGAVGAADGSSNVIFFASGPKFISGLRGSKKTMIELEFYQAGVQRLDFNTDKL
jgi:hypothetical protein